MIGQLRHRVVLQSQVQTQDDIGQPSTAWLDDATIWADLRHQSGLEAIKNGMDVSVVKASARIRYRAVNAGQRLTHGSTTYSITAVLPDAKRAYVDLVCESVNAEL